MVDTKQPAVAAARAEREAELAEALRRSQVKAASERQAEAERRTPGKGDSTVSR